MIDSSTTWIGKYGKALTGTALGVVVALCFTFMELQRRADITSREATETKLFQLFADHQKDMKDTARNQWQNQSKIADGLNAVALEIARMNELMRIPIDQRPKVSPTSEPPKPITLKPPM